MKMTNFCAKDALLTKTKIGNPNMSLSGIIIKTHITKIMKNMFNYYQNNFTISEISGSGVY